MAEAGLHYDPNFVSADERAEIVRWLASIQPIWENRFGLRRAAAAGGQRRLLRPVYWLGSWQFACLDYYRPPHGVANACVAAEPYPEVLTRLVSRIEKLARQIDCARVGEHRDFEPGPVASLSLGERALFQFVKRGQADSSGRSSTCACRSSRPGA